jgi:hypothetical protein
VDHVHDVLARVGSRAVLFEERCDGAASGRDVDGLEEAVRVSEIKVLAGEALIWQVQSIDET